MSCLRLFLLLSSSWALRLESGTITLILMASSGYYPSSGLSPRYHRCLLESSLSNLWVMDALNSCSPFSILYVDGVEMVDLVEIYGYGDPSSAHIAQRLPDAAYTSADYSNTRLLLDLTASMDVLPWEICIALTFSDGPLIYSCYILDISDKCDDAKETLFITGMTSGKKQPPDIDNTPIRLRQEVVQLRGRQLIQLEMVQSKGEPLKVEQLRKELLEEEQSVEEQSIQGEYVQWEEVQVVHLELEQLEKQLSQFGEQEGFPTSPGIDPLFRLNSHESLTYGRTESRPATRKTRARLSLGQISPYWDGDRGAMCREHKTPPSGVARAGAVDSTEIQARPGFDFGLAPAEFRGLSILSTGTTTLRVGSQPGAPLFGAFTKSAGRMMSRLTNAFSHLTRELFKVCEDQDQMQDIETTPAQGREVIGYRTVAEKPGRLIRTITIDIRSSRWDTAGRNNQLGNGLYLYSVEVFGRCSKGGGWETYGDPGEPSENEIEDDDTSTQTLVFVILYELVACALSRKQQIRVLVYRSEMKQQQPIAGSRSALFTPADSNPNANANANANPKSNPKSNPGTNQSIGPGGTLADGCCLSNAVAER
ncbi:hypothetical protein MBM_09786 [Drepanopeziza brunnea f. sp. 'multigermtubi' MB_m1]|uniref:Uncharacterized protein n=1 Tax=Marssonina brunnea f. sp. multigermtubi (strain MB_m1) TaxID=1072389 RepID=K1WIP3_MARBU|nr:uncharacterized protein MBM_09786 [Drepanopeziza brunnea f. sp. 'multigermtubi' MB_m1]EKD12052.1 hypothetical protein MBM_09786 [Drepanopeziza brunnea f. sp. 'multigermtubi' MB_m1]